jgi:RimJ/RimL family protein N-acetyltransferase
MRNWPLFGLRLTTPRLDLHLPSLLELDELADLAADGVHDPAEMPFGVPWTDASPADRARSTVQHHWASWGSWVPQEWHCHFVVVADGRVVGTQDIAARDFAVVREVSTGSWLGRAHQGQGIGTQMRAAVLALAFAGLDAQSATSAAFLDNPASLRVSRRLGYQPDGVQVDLRRGERATQQRLRLSRANWEAHRSVPVEIHELSACLPLFGAA